MATEYIHYVKRRIKTRYSKDLCSPWYAELQDYNSGFEQPIFHVTRATYWPVNEIKKGDVIWLISELSSPWGKLPVCLDARLVVGRVERIELPNSKSKIKFWGTGQSEWFPLQDLSKKIAKIIIQTKDGSLYFPMDKCGACVGQEFQSIKKVSNAQILYDMREDLNFSPYEFVSYRIVDGTKGAFFHVKVLVDSGKNVFWDRWSLPRRLAERRELVSDEALDKLLLDKMYNSRVIWGIESNRYSEQGSYSNKEKKVALQLNKYIAVNIQSRSLK